MIITKGDILEHYKNKMLGERALEKFDYVFPLNDSENLAGIIGDMFGDGHLQGDPRWRIDYTSKSVSELNRFGREIKRVFNVKGKIRECKTNRFGRTFNYGVNNKAIARILFAIGVPKGNKVLQPFSIPAWILNDKTYFRRFIQRLFDCEGAPDSEGAIMIEMWKSQDLLEEGLEFFQSIKLKLKEYFDIDTSNPFTYKTNKIRKDGIKTVPIRLKIRRKDSITKFFKEIGFENSEKQRKLSLFMR